MVCCPATLDIIVPWLVYMMPYVMRHHDFQFVYVFHIMQLIFCDFALITLAIDEAHPL
jgi:hypothetical protein